MTFMVDNDGILRDPNLHDGFVDGVHLLNDKTLRVSLRDISGTAFVMEVSGVVALTCNGFERRNIILDIIITSGSTPDMQILRSLFRRPYPSASRRAYDEYNERLDRFANRIREGALSLISLESSVGCWLVALCERVLIVPKV